MKLTGAIHAHSTHSYDGKLPLGELKKLLFKHGLSFCCVTEHTDELTPEGAAAFVAECEKYTDQAFAFIPGFEVPYKDAHVLFIGTTKFWGQTADSASLWDWRSSTPWVVLAHPVRNRFVVDDPLLEVIDGIEVWNEQYEGKAAPRFRSLRLLQTLQQTRPELLATGGLDLHREEHFGAPLIELETYTVDGEEILNQLRHGFYDIKSKRVVLDSHGAFKKGGGFLTKLKSVVSIMFINTGKAINALLAMMGLRFPKGLSRFIRGRV